MSDDAAPNDSPAGRLDRAEAWLERRGVWLAAALGLVAAVALGVRIVRADRPRGDTRFYREGAQRFLAGENLYYLQPRPRPHGYAPTTGYTYLPPFAPLSAWMVPLPYAAVRMVWLVACLACAAFTLHRARALAGPDPPLDRVTLALTTLAVLRFGWNDLAHGQVNWLVALLLLEVLRRREGVGAGVALGVALAIKPTAWPLVPFFLLLKRWRLVGACAATGGGLVGLSLLRYGSGAPALLADWFALMRGFTADSAVSTANASLSSAVTRLLTGGQLTAADPVTPLLLELPRETALGAGRGVALLVGLVVFAVCVRRGRQDPGPTAAVAVVLLSALVSPVTWKAHLVVLVFPLVLLMARHLRGPPRPRWIVIGAVALLVVPSRALGVQVGRLEACGSMSLALLTLLVVLLWPTPRLEAAS